MPLYYVHVMPRVALNVKVTVHLKATATRKKEARQHFNTISSTPAHNLNEVIENQTLLRIGRHMF
jgi:hypothetical protein